MALPVPSLEMRKLVGPTDPALFDNPNGTPIFPDLPLENYETVFDFGCGCGRVARQLIQQNPRPLEYVGIDLHLGMVNWCQNNLAPHANGFEFMHHNVFDRGFNPQGSSPTLPFPVHYRRFKLIIAWSVFTHLLEEQAVFYIQEIARIIDPKGIAKTTWFIFDKRFFPMMHEFQNALYINPKNPINAVIFDHTWIRQTLMENQLKIIKASPPKIRGFQWFLDIVPLSNPAPEVDFPEDLAPFGLNRPPIQENPSEVK